MNSAQIGLGFLSPEVASHTFPEFIGAWNSLEWKDGEIRTVDGRKLSVSAKLSDSDGGDVVTAMINRDEFQIDRTACYDWIFRGDSVAQVISAVAIGQKPALFIEHEKRFEAMRREADRRNRIETKKILRDLHKQLEQERQQGVEP